MADLFDYVIDSLLILFLPGCAYLFWIARRMESSKRMLVRITACVFSIGFCLAVGGVIYVADHFGKTTESGSLLSSDGKRSAKLFVIDDGALGGSDTVRAAELSSSGVVYAGGWETVDWMETNWRNPREFEVVYRGNGLITCQSFSDVTVRCTKLADFLMRKKKDTFK
jgi:hypothetical protein